MNKLTLNLDETADSIIKDLTMVSESIRVNTSKKLDKDFANTIPSMEER